ncbi:MAG: type II secretion system protein [Pyrinomonadaceae bacterium]
MIFGPRQSESKIGGFTLFELIATLTVLSILILGTLPLMHNAVKRQKEMRLRQNLREIREAIDAFKRDAVGACLEGSIRTGNPAVNPGGANLPADPRSRVVIDDCEIFDTENLDRLPPSLEVLVDGVKVKARGLPAQAVSRGAFSDKNATELAEEKEITKVYLREIPKDPITGEDDWILRSSYQSADSTSWDNINVFDVRSASEETALNGEKYSSW